MHPGLSAAPLCWWRCCAGAMRSGPRKPMVLYTTMSREQVAMARDVRGGDEARMSLVTGEHAVKLVGRSGLDRECTLLLQDILR